MSTRLTKALREEIAARIYKASDLPGRLEALVTLAKTTVVEMAKASRPPEFVELLKTQPHGWFPSINHMYVGSGMQRADGSRINLSCARIGDLYANNIKFDDSIPYPADLRCSPPYVAAAYEWLHDVYAPMYGAWEDDKAKLTRDTNGLLNSYRTVEALLKDVPELEKLMPRPASGITALTVPVSNVIATFLERGIDLQAA